LRYWQGN